MAITELESKSSVVEIKSPAVRSKNKRLFWFIGTICAVAIALATTAFFGAFASVALGTTIPQAVVFGFICFAFVIGFGLVTS